MVHLNGACRTPGDWSTRESSGLWTRHAHDNTSSSVLDYSVISAEHLDTVKSMEVDQDGRLGGDADHNFVLTRLQDKFVIVTRAARDQEERGWNIEEEDQDWSRFKEVVSQRLEEGAGAGEGTVEELNHTVTGALLAGLKETIGRRRPRRAENERRFPKEIVKLLHERKMLETKWKKEKVEFANSRSSVPRNSLIVIGQELKQMRERVQEEIEIFYRQRRGPLLKACRTKTRTGRKTFWRYVSRKFRSSEEISSLQRKDSGMSWVRYCTDTGKVNLKTGTGCQWVSIINYIRSVVYNSPGMIYQVAVHCILHGGHYIAVHCALCMVLDRPGVAGAVLQTASLLSH